MNVGQTKGSRFALRDDQIPTFDVQVFGQNSEMKDQVIKTTNAICHVKDKRIRTLVGD